MAINKVDFAGQTLIDLTKDTVTAPAVFAGETAHDKAGNPIAGTFTIQPELAAQDSKIAAIVQALKGKGSGQGGSGGGGSVAPFARIEIEKWTPPDDTKTYTVKNPQNLLGLAMFFDNREDYSDIRHVSFLAGACSEQVGVITNTGKYSFSYSTDSPYESSHRLPAFYDPKTGIISLEGTSNDFQGYNVTYYVVKFYGPLE